MRRFLLAVLALAIAGCGDGPTEPAAPDTWDLVSFTDSPLPVRVSNTRSLYSLRLELADSARFTLVTADPLMGQDPDITTVTVAYSRSDDGLFFAWTEPPLFTDATLSDGRLYGVLSVVHTSGLAILEAH